MKNQTFIVYFDEAGRWPLAGPVYIGLICPLQKISKKELEIFRDSKQLSESIRERHFQVIQDLQECGKILTTPARATAAEIDNYGMTNVLHLSILRGMILIFGKLYPHYFKNFQNFTLPTPLSTKLNSRNFIKYSDILSSFSNLNNDWIKIKLVLDGNRDFWLKRMFPFWDFETIISWDDKVKEISMASIVAKVSRDRTMEKLPKKYNKYNFPKHKWYGTKEHKDLIKNYWPSDIHRKLFLKWIFPNHQIQKKLPSKF